jgi:CubicO group peptidase (beta-lactamase class C family)
MKLRKTCALFLCAMCTAALLGQDLVRAKRPEGVGFSSERLKVAGQALQTAVDKSEIPGAVLLIARNGQIAYFEAFGYQDRSKLVPMKTDSIFRIASMTKPITSTAVMMLAEEGKIDLAAPIAQYLPEFKDVKVGAESSGTGELTLEAPRRPITVEDLLRHTSGLTYGLFGDSAVDQLYKKADLFDRNQTLAEFINKITKLPLAHQPGTAWEYSMSTDVLGRLVEVVSDKPFDQFVADRITKPLHMNDTAFYLSNSQAQRLALQDSEKSSEVEALATTKPKFISGGGGLVSTAMDYARFCQMMLNGGELNDVRLLAPKTVDLMTADALPPGVSRTSYVATLMLGPSNSFGLGFAVRTEPGMSPVPGSVGDYFWAGILGTSFWVDPKERLLAVFMVQLPQSKIFEYFHLTRQLVYQALVG